MEYLETVIFDETWQVNRRLSELNLDRSRLSLVRNAAIRASADAGPLFPATSPGTFSYFYGTQELRVQFLESIWETYRKDGIEGIFDLDTKTIIVFQNVDVACSKALSPKPRSRKGAGSERVCLGNLFDVAGVKFPTFAPIFESSWTTYYFMVGEDGAAELSRPVIRNGAFVAFIERIFVCDSEELEDEVFQNTDDVVSDFEVGVNRKK